MLGYLSDAAGLSLFKSAVAAAFGGEPANSSSSVYLYTGSMPTDGTGAPTGTLLGSGSCTQSSAAAATTDTYKNAPVYSYSVDITADGTVGYVAITASGYAPKSGIDVLFLTVGDSSSGAECVIDKADVANGDTVSVTLTANIF
jgi:hypothetical protein